NLMAGDASGASKCLNLRQTYERNDLFTEVNSMWNRALDAYKKAETASKLADQNRDAEAAQLMHEASAEYPQSDGLAISAMTMDGRAAFERKDYDAFLQISRTGLEKWPNEPREAAGVASALACKYALTGDPQYRKQSEEMLDRAQVLSANSPEDKASFAEYSERIRYRLTTREILDTDEYNRRFRKQEAKQ